MTHHVMQLANRAGPREQREITAELGPGVDSRAATYCAATHRRDPRFRRTAKRGYDFSGSRSSRNSAIIANASARSISLKTS